MFCSRCGTWAPDDLTTCTLCGLALQVDNWPKPVEPARPPAPVVALVTYGGFWRRVAGVVIDGVVLYFPAAIVRVWLGLPAWGSSGEFTPAVVVAFLFEMLIDWLYAATLISSAGRGTLGQRVMDLHVTDLAGGRVSFLRASVRYWATLLTFATGGIGGLIQLWTARRQTLHDMVAGTVVVRPRREPASTPSPVMRLVQ